MRARLAELAHRRVFSHRRPLNRHSRRVEAEAVYGRVITIVKDVATVLAAPSPPSYTYHLYYFLRSTYYQCIDPRTVTCYHRPMSEGV